MLCCGAYKLSCIHVGRPLCSTAVIWRGRVRVLYVLRHDSHNPSALAAREYFLLRTDIGSSLSSSGTVTRRGSRARRAIFRLDRFVAEDRAHRTSVIETLSTRVLIGRFLRQPCLLWYSGSAWTAAPCTASGVPSAIGYQTLQNSTASRRRWRSHIRSVAKQSAPITERGS
jgi:hypothetical protein